MKRTLIVQVRQLAGDRCDDCHLPAARAGELTADDEIEIDNYRQLGWLIESMKSKARLFLRNTSA